MKNRAVQYALTFSQVVKISVLKLGKELNKAFCMLMKQVAPEPINSFSRQYSCGIGAWVPDGLWMGTKGMFRCGC